VVTFDKSDLESLQVDSLRARVYQQIKKMILTNRLWPGQQIVIDQLVKQLGISHTPVREALSMLEGDGLVVIERYKNARVTSVTETDVREVYEMRLLLEGWAVAQAARNLPDQALNELDAQLNKIREEIVRSRFDTFLEADLALHNKILEAVSNRLYTRILQLISNQSTRIRSLVEATHPVEIMHQILDEHCAILNALRARNPELARREMEQHLAAAMGRTLSALQDIPNTK